ncbi:VCBS repeat-containing protein [Treponema sp. HNW]|uniref:FG-GAP repeat domain-containing protein n=1 Tax=Treponema sp. HNW TaxID=3116654 RepID=UPI003D1369D7
MSTTSDLPPVPKQAKKGTKKKKHGFFLTLIVTLFIIILITVLPAVAFLIYSSLDGADPAEHIPQGFYAYVNLPSAGDFLQKTVSVQTLDALLTGANTEKLQGTLRSVRASPVLSAKWFDKASDFRLDAAVYADGAYLVCAKLGFRSAASRLLPYILRYRPDVFSSVKELSAENENGTPFWIYRTGDSQQAYIGFYKDLMIASASKDVFMKALHKTGQDSPADAAQNNEHIGIIKRFIKKSGRDALSVLTDMNYFTSHIQNDTFYGNVISRLNFPEYTTVNFNLNKKEMSVSGNCVWDSDSEGLKIILQNKSAVPGILARLPESTDYVTLLKMGTPAFLFENGTELLGKNIIKAYENAANSVRFLFQKDIQELLFSWMGDEIGIIGTVSSEEPVFFVSLKDENRCRDVFSHIFSTLFVQQDVSAVVQGIRIPRIEFPDVIKALVRSFKFELSTPFYIIQDGYLYLSQSAEALGALTQEAKSGKLLVKTDNWKTIARAVSPETSVFAYYTLNSRVPTFLKHNAALKAVMKDYGRGVVSVKLDSAQKLRFELYTQKTDSTSREELASFPYDCGVKVQSHIYSGKTAKNVPYAYWTSANSVYALNLAQRSTRSISLDDTAYLGIETERGIIKAVWAVSARGTVYKTDYDLNPFEGFPLLTGERVSAPPAILSGTIAVSLADKNTLLFIDSDARTYFSEEMNAKLKQPPRVFGHTLAAHPRSFDSLVYLFDTKGNILPGYPIEADSISAVQPLLYREPQAGAYMAVLTEDGVFTLLPVILPAAGKRTESFDKNGQDRQTFSVSLDAASKVQPVYSPSLNMFFAADENGTLYKIDTQCRIVDKTSLKPKTAHNRIISLLDFNGDGTDEIFVSGGGNAIYAYNNRLMPLEGFPVAGTGLPRIIDVDGDGFAELLTCGIDNTIHAYRGITQ